MKNTETPLVSVVLSVYNRQNTLVRSLNSLVAQSFRNWELIAIDDGSTDGSSAILEEYAGLFNNIKVFKQENRKLAFSRNRGILLAKGDYITFLDSDDEYKENHLAKRVEFMGNNPGTDLIHGGFRITGDEFVRDKNNKFCFIHISACAVGATFFGKPNVFEELDGFKENIYSEDSEFLMRAEKMYNVKKVNFPTYIYHREIVDSITHNYVP